MRSAPALVACSLFLSAAPAFAQTLSIEVEGAAPAFAAPPPPAEIAAAQSSTSIETAPSPAIVPQPQPQLQPQYQSPSQPQLQAAPARPENEGWGGFYALIEGYDLSAHAMRMGRPEISVLAGTRLDPQWTGMRALSSVMTGGAGVSVGMRSFGLLRAPELRLSLSGGEVEGQFAPVPGAPAEIEVAARSVLLLRAEVAAGLQAELGVLTPYVLLRGSVAAYWLGVEVRHATLGGLGSEHLDDVLFELGLEVGTGIRFAPGFEMQLGFRMSFLGPTSFGGVIGFNFGG
ncbi:MAG: hypothetical protein K8H88_07680 [Sandaracinaceae bacterium]|nr:hypothetical protein [Sandaracinaceae bacterium]